MQAHVKTPRTDIRIKGDIPPPVLDVLKAEYGDKLKVYQDDVVEVTETDWYKGLVVTPGDALRTYRENAGLTQAKLGELLDGVPRQHISNMENNHRAISLDMAKKLSIILHTKPERFLDL